MFGTSIGSRVKKVIAQRVKDAQKKHDEKCAALDALCEEEKMRAEQNRDEHKERHAAEMVSSIIGGNFTVKVPEEFAGASFVEDNE